MDGRCKIQLAGVGGQGVIFLTKLLVEAALEAAIPVATSEIHGLSQRGGSVAASVTLGEGTYGFIEKGGADFLFGLELLEAQRSLMYLHTNSIAIIDDYRITPYTVNAGNQAYPDPEQLKKFLDKSIKKLVLVKHQQEIKDILRNVFLMGVATEISGFPIDASAVRRAINNIANAHNKEASLDAFEQGRNYYSTQHG